MQFIQQLSGDGNTYALSGKFSFTDHTEFKKIVDVVKAGGVASVTLDMAGVEFIDSAALGMLLILREECQKSGVGLVFAQAQGQVEKMFRISKFETLFTLRC